jgi:hypothetical protein
MILAGLLTPGPSAGRLSADGSTVKRELCDIGRVCEAHPGWSWQTPSVSGVAQPALPARAAMYRQTANRHARRWR